MLCERLQLDVSRKVDDLSFGNRKKVAIVCTLQHRPKLLILDEPTSGLDPLMQKEFFDILSLTEGDDFREKSTSRINNTLNNSKRKAEELEEIINCFDKNELIMVKAALEKLNQ